MADAAANTGETEIALGLLFVKTIKCIVDAQLLHAKEHGPDSGVRGFVDHSLLVGEGFAVGVYRFVVVGDVVHVMVVIMAMLDDVAVFIHVGMQMLAHSYPSVYLKFCLVVSIIACSDQRVKFDLRIQLSGILMCNSTVNQLYSGWR